MRNKRGFTLVELLIVIGIIGFLAAAILVAVDPVKRIQDARNAKRWAEVNGILNAILTRQVDDKALFAGSVANPIVSSDTLAQVIVRADAAAGACAAAGTKPLCPTVTTSDLGVACVANLAGLVPNNLAELPADPASNAPATGPVLGDNNTGYYIMRNLGNRIEIGSCWPDQGATVKVKR